MLIYTNRNNGSSHTSFGASGYKSASKQKRSGIRAKTSKRITHRRQSQVKSKVKKNSKRKSINKRKKKKKLNAKNVKFLKKLGFRVKKH